MWHNSDHVNIKLREEPKNSSNRKLQFVNFVFFSQIPRHLNGEVGETNQVSKHELTYTRIAPSAY